MKYCLTETAGVHHTDAVSARTFLQQAVDHYPRLVAFSFSLVLPYRDTITEYRSLILRFHTEVWQRTGEYSRERQQELPTFTAHYPAMVVGGGQCARMQNGAADESRYVGSCT